MRVITLILNGIRSAARKGFYAWLPRQRADVVCLQELEAQTDQLDDRQFWPPSFRCYSHHVVTPGLRDRVRTAAISRRKRGSDHAPLMLDHDIDP